MSRETTETATKTDMFHEMSSLSVGRLNFVHSIRCRPYYFHRAAHMQGGLSHERNVCLSVCLSVKRANCDKTKETYAYILIP